MKCNCLCGKKRKTLAPQAKQLIDSHIDGRFLTLRTTNGNFTTYVWEFRNGGGEWRQLPVQSPGALSGIRTAQDAQDRIRGLK